MVSQKGQPKWRSQFAKRGNTVAGTYNRKDCLNLIFNAFAVQDNNDRAAVERSPLLNYYANHKCSVDQFNQLWSNYHFRHPHHSVLQNEIISIFEFSITNAYILYNMNQHRPMKGTQNLVTVSCKLLNKDCD